MKIVTAESPVPPPQASEVYPMPLRPVPAVPENVVQLQPPKLEVLDPVQYARSVVALHGGGRHRAPEPPSPNCGLWWSQELDRFDVDLVCTLPKGHRQNLHQALDGNWESHGCVIDERLAA